MRLSRRKKNGSGGTADAVQSRLEKVFKLPGENTSLNVFTRDDKGRLQYLDSIPLSDVTASTLLDVIKDGYGGGRFQIVPMGGDKKAGESFEVSVHGESKLTKKKTPDDSERGQKRTSKRTETEKENSELREKLREFEEKGRDDRLLERLREEIEKAVGKRDGSGEVVDAILKNLPQIVAGVSGLFGNRESVSDMLEKVSTVVKNVGGDGGMDPFQLVSGVLQLLNQHNQQQTRAPVQTTGSNSTGVEKFFEALGAAAPAFAPMLAARLSPGTAAATPAALGPNTIPANAPGLATPRTEAAFAGAEGTHSPTTPPDTSRVVAPINPLSALAAQIGSAEGGVMDPSFAAYGALMKLRYMIDQKDDPYSVAAEIIDSINLIMGSQRIAGRWQNFITVENVEALFDQYAPMIPEFAIDPAYTAECRAVLVEAVRDQLSPDSEEAAGEEKQTEAAEEKTLTPDERQAQETASAEGQDADENVEDEKVEDVEPESEVREEAPA